MKNEYKSILMFAALFIAAGYIYEKSYSPTNPVNIVAAKQAPGPGGVTLGNLPLTGSTDLTALVPYDEVT